MAAHPARAADDGQRCRPCRTESELLIELAPQRRGRLLAAPDAAARQLPALRAVVWRTSSSSPSQTRAAFTPGRAGTHERGKPEQAVGHAVGGSARTEPPAELDRMRRLAQI